MLAFMTVEQNPASDRIATAQALGAGAPLPLRPPCWGDKREELSRGQESLAKCYRSAGSMPMT